MAICVLCAKGSMTGNNVPKSVHKTSRKTYPNLQKMMGMMVCTRCARTIKKYSAVAA